MKSNIATTVCAILLIALLLCGYLAGYLCLGDEWRPPGPGSRLRMRVFDHGWLATLYRPPGRVESWIRGYGVQIGTQEDLYRSSP